jgi:hypothetical protein
MRELAVFAHVSEKAEEHLGDQLMAALGFTAIRFSQPRKTMQTRGIPDRRYYAPRFKYPELRRQLSVWWEAKREGGKQSEHQRRFQALVESCGEEYVCGPFSALEMWCRSKGLIL